MTKLTVVAALLCAACGGDPPTCQDALTKFYGVGCALLDGNGNEYTRDESIMNCRAALAETPASCEDEFGDLRECWASATGAADCTMCDAEVEAILTCD